MRTGYKEMLRDRCPVVVDYALKYCKAKNRWIEHAYKSFIKFYADKHERDIATRKTLGIVKGKPKLFDFHSTIDWDNISTEEKEYWEYVESWVEWFRHCFSIIQNSYKISISVGESLDIFKQRLCNETLKDSSEQQRIKLSEFLLKCLNKFPERI